MSLLAAILGPTGRTTSVVSLSAASPASGNLPVETGSCLSLLWVCRVGLILAVLIDRLHTYCRLNAVLMQTHADFAKNPPPIRHLAACKFAASSPLVRCKFAASLLLLRFFFASESFALRFFPLFSVCFRCGTEK